MPSVTSSTSGRRPWVALAIRGWRLELALVAASLFVLGLSERLGPGGPVLVIALAVAVLWLRPDLRERFRKVSRENADVRQLHYALWHCVVVGRNGRIPEVVRTAALPVGRRYLVSLPVGLHLAAIESHAPELAAALGAREVRVRRYVHSARYVEIVVIYRSAFPARLRSHLVAGSPVSLWEPLRLGVGEDGLVVPLRLPEHNLLIGGEPGSGKSVALSTIVAASALDHSVQLTLLDGKQVELAPWAAVARRFVGPDQEEAIDALQELHGLMDERYRHLLSTQRRKIARDGVEGLHVVVIDELAFYLRGGRKEHRDLFAELLRDLVSRGRAAGVIVVAATQKPSFEVVPTWIRDLFAYRLAMRCTSTDASDTILGQGWAQQGYSASSIDPAQRGVGYLLAEGGVPILLKTPFLSDDEVDALARLALDMRRAL